MSDNPGGMAMPGRDGAGGQEADVAKFKIAVDSRAGTSYYFDCPASDVHEQLRRIGLEWKQADWAHDQAVIITIAPVDKNDWGAPTFEPEAAGSQTKPDRAESLDQNESSGGSP